MMDERYRDELNQIRLTNESREDLARALAARQEQPAQRPRRRWSRTAVAAAGLGAVLGGPVGGGGGGAPGGRRHLRANPR